MGAVGLLVHLQDITNTPGQADVRIEILSVSPVKESGLDKAYRINGRIVNHAENAVFLETRVKGARRADFVKFEKKLCFPPFWLQVWGFQDAPAPYIFALKPGETVDFEASVGQGVCTDPCDVIPIRGTLRVRLRYFSNTQEFEKAKQGRGERSLWIISEPFRVE
jgi:hypothetical protein